LNISSVTFISEYPCHTEYWEGISAAQTNQLNDTLKQTQFKIN